MLHSDNENKGCFPKNGQKISLTVTVYSECIQLSVYTKDHAYVYTVFI